MRICGLYIEVKNHTEETIKEALENIYGQFSKVYEKWNKEIKELNLLFRSVSYCENGIILWDQELALDIMTKQSQEAINNIYNAFDHPSCMLAFMHFDSGDSFGFSYIVKNEIIRFRYNLSNEIGHKEYGTPLEEEKIILDGKFYEIDDGEKLYKRLDDIENPRSYHFICSELANEVMRVKIGYDMNSDEINANYKIFTFRQEDEKSNVEKENIFTRLKKLLKGK